MGTTEIIYIAIGLIISFQGIMLIKSQSLSKISPSQCAYVKPCDVKAFTIKSGTVVVQLGTSSIIAAIINIIFQTNYGYISLIVGVVIYVVMLLILQNKYNKKPEN